MYLQSEESSVSGYMFNGLEGVERNFTNIEVIRCTEYNIFAKAKRYGRWWILKGIKTEKAIFDAYIARMPTKEVMILLNIKENTLKFHNKNLYLKLGVSSRKELLEVYKQIQPAAEPHDASANVAE